jgi:cytochrome c-type biogenesis protein CcmF
MASLGYYLLLAAFVAGAYATAMSVAGARRRSRPMIESGIGAFYLLAAIMTAASSVIIYSFLTGDYSIVYVQRYSDAALPMFYKITSYWGGLDGSIMFWVFLLSLFGSAAIYINRDRHRELIPYVVAVISVVEMFFLYLMIVHNNPFETFLTQNPTDGTGLNPLLQNFYMVIHPPTMYLGFVGLTIPYAFGMAALITGYLDDSWLRAVRRWTMFAWLFLSIGLGLGMIWAYEELGWGGYWMWDPVENAGLLPWFTATAFLHSVMVQERRGMLRAWNVSLVILTFFLTLFGTFMTRSGIVQSVHSFGQDPVLSQLFTIFMVGMLVFSFGFVIYRMPLLRARNELDSWVSREAAFMFNNWILLFCAVFVLFATMFPTLSEAVTGDRITVGPPFFNQWMVPIGLTLLLLTGIGPLLAWRKSTVVNLRDQFLFPILSGLLVGGVVVALGVRIWGSGLCFAFSGFVLGTITQEFWRGARVRQQTSGTDLATALIGLVGRNKRRYGGYIIHVAIVLMFLGFAGGGFKKHETALMTPGQEIQVGDYVIRHNSIAVTDDERKQMITADMTVLRDGVELTKMYPARWFFRKHEDQPTTEVAIRRTFAEDLYIVMPQFDAAQQSANVEITVTPLVNWVWLGFGVMALGTLIALLPETAFAFATARVPEGAKTATASLLLLAIVLPAAVQAQDGTPGRVSKTALHREVEGQIICMCGSPGCVRATLENCPMRPACHGHSAQLASLQKYIDEGKNHDAILAEFVREYGGAVLAVPSNSGFNSLAWVLPYLLAGFGLVALVLTARRWSARPAAAGAGGADVTLDSALDARLDDELRDLD